MLLQTFVIDGESQVAKVLEKASKDLGAPVKIVGYVRFAVGEGIDKPVGDFAAEVKSMGGQ
jgi:elongation factor Ts